MPRSGLFLKTWTDKNGNFLRKEISGRKIFWIRSRTIIETHSNTVLKHAKNRPFKTRKMVFPDWKQLKNETCENTVRENFENNPPKIAMLKTQRWDLETRKTFSVTEKKTILGQKVFIEKKVLKSRAVLKTQKFLLTWSSSRFEPMFTCFPASVTKQRNLR